MDGRAFAGRRLRTGAAALAIGLWSGALVMLPPLCRPAYAATPRQEAALAAEVDTAAIRGTRKERVKAVVSEGPWALIVTAPSPGDAAHFFHLDVGVWKAVAGSGNASSRGEMTNPVGVPPDVAQKLHDKAQAAVAGPQARPSPPAATMDKLVQAGNIAVLHGRFAKAIAEWQQAMPLDANRIVSCRGAELRTRIRAANDTIARLERGTLRPERAAVWFWNHNTELFAPDPCNLP